MFAGGTSGGGGALKERREHPTAKLKLYAGRADEAKNRFPLFLPHSLLVIGALAMLAEVEAFALYFFCHPKSDRELDEVESNC